ncbi:GNAT family N-acetyltransferase [Chryseomicrobium palamuruense]|uniref:GNAT family N-acetyltransferase n=1 Tax=Chryseomicrobium palamuruense TaxID=682973 RepID=A0ABV8UYG6_9BACL
MENVAGLEISLRPLTMNDFPEVAKWSQDHLFCQANEWTTNRDANELLAWWERCVENDSPTFLRLGIEYSGRLIGYIDLADQTDTSTELGIAIGESSLWQQGIGTKAAQLAITYASKRFRIHHVTAETNLENLRAQKMLEKLGFEIVSQNGSTLFFRKTIV